MTASRLVGAGGPDAERGSHASRVIAAVLTGAIRGYQAIVSPWFAPRCKYYPSCSAYAVAAIRTNGPVKGSSQAVWRVLRCNPWSHGGVDYVPGSAEEAISRSPGFGQ